MHTRPGVTLIEVLVALVVFSVAALGSAAALGVAARARQTESARREALSALQLRAATMAVTRCDSLASGEGVVGGVDVSWNVSIADSLAHLSLLAMHRNVLTRLDTDVVCQ
jgi:prepilin-type N-terminal cleavage/methylation domain-containing protein